MSLFIHLLKSPNLESTASDIILTEMAGGFFARLEYATDLTISFQMLKDVPRFARRAVERAKSMAQEPDIHVANTLELSDSTQVLDPYVVDNTLDFNQEVSDIPSLEPFVVIKNYTKLRRRLAHNYCGSSAISWTLISI